jgi:putative flavoprotein involved in K+ transport
MHEKIETIIIGGGQAGLSTSYQLKQRGRENIVLEKAAQAGNAWRNDRWDSFTLLTPNWSFQLPGAAYRGNRPDGFMGRDEVVASIEEYAGHYQLPIYCNITVKAVEQNPDGHGYQVTTDEAVLQAVNVVIATGLYQKPKRTPFTTGLSKKMTQLASGQYRNPVTLPPGAVLVIGSGQSGCQIAEELYLSGRQVYLCVGNAGRVPRRYRGKDIYDWLNRSGFLDRTVDKLPSPRSKFTANPSISGLTGGHTLNLHQFARDGVVLLGHLLDICGDQLWLAPDLRASLASADNFEAEVVRSVDAYIEGAGIAAPKESLSEMRDGFDAKEITNLNLRSAGITTVIWAQGYAYDFSLVKLPIFDSDGYPIQKNGATDYSGLYFVGLPWLSKQKSGLLLGVGEDADFIAASIADRKE